MPEPQPLVDRDAGVPGSDLAEADGRLRAATRLPLSEIPVIDIHALGGHDAGELRNVADRLGRACEEVGFFYVRRHGVPEDLVDAVFGAARAFFSLPIEAKTRIPATREHYRGYMAMLARTYGKNGYGDYSEAFKMNIDLAPDDPDVVAGKPLHQLNKWPEDLPGFRETLLRYFDAMHALQARLLRAFALVLDTDEDFFQGKFTKPLTQLTLLHYPPQPADRPEDEFGLRPHTDTSAITILAQDETGGLDVYHRSGEWIAAPCIPGTFLVNIGDMMQRWTNDRFVSTPHRVINRTGRARYSIPFFANPDYDAVVECVPSCASADRPARYPPLHVGSYVYNRFTSQWRDEGS